MRDASSALACQFQLHRAQGKEQREEPLDTERKSSWGTYGLIAFFFFLQNYRLHSEGE